MSKQRKLRSTKPRFYRSWSLCVILAALAIAPTVACADEIAIGTINVTDGVVTGFPTMCYSFCGEAGATNNMSDTSLIWQSAIFFDNRLPLTPPVTVGPGVTTPPEVAWASTFAGIPQFGAFGILSNSEFTVNGVLYEVDPANPLWMTLWVEDFTGQSPIIISADPVGAPEPGMLLMLSASLLTLALFRTTVASCRPWIRR